MIRPGAGNVEKAPPAPTLWQAAAPGRPQESLAAAVQWPSSGLPDNPRGWLITVASRRLLDQLRAESARRRREVTAAALEPAVQLAGPAPGDAELTRGDETLTLLLLCCHPALSPPSQVALTLRAVGGLTTVQIASAFLVPEATMAQRIREIADPFRMPPEPERAQRLRVVLHVLYLIFNEGYTATSGPDLHRPELTTEALRLAREVHRLLPDDGEVTGLLALMLLTEARRPTRTRPDGALVPLAEQDRTRWNRDAIAEGIELVTGAMTSAPLGPYQLQAAIAAVHAEAKRAEDTDWLQIAALYRLLAAVSPGPVVTLNRAVAVAMADGPQAGLDLLATLDGDQRMAGRHRLDAVRAHLLEMAAQLDAARSGYLLAARRTASLPERRYLESRAARLKP